MAVSEHWNTHNFLTLTYSGVVGGEDLRWVTTYLGAESRLDDMRYLLSDWREAYRSTINIDDVEAFAVHIAAIAKSNARVAHASVMYPRDESRQSLFALYDLLLKDCPWKVASFIDKQKAENWLDTIRI